jgi:glutathione synthase/RimK-type ligase-like ATP-grasp enzyme
MINIAILTNDLENENEWFFKYIHNYAKDKDITFLRCMVKEYSVIKKEFENIREYDHNKQLYVKTSKKIDLVWPRFNRIFFKLSCIHQKIPLINNHTLYELARDKWITYENLTLYSPYSTLLSNITNDESLVDNFSSEYVILKPRTGSK